MNLLCSALTVLFVGLKLTGHIDWSWIGVIAPALVNLVALLGIACVEAYDSRIRYRW